MSTKQELLKQAQALTLLTNGFNFDLFRQAILTFCPDQANLLDESRLGVGGMITQLQDTYLVTWKEGKSRGGTGYHLTDQARQEIKDSGLEPLDKNQQVIFLKWAIDYAEKLAGSDKTPHPDIFATHAAIYRETLSMLTKE